ncbi:hypothetical protein BKA82DRAFT_167060 [Pisolithus tinctorius]|uniref:CCHC-type domain-containing protein n=1 Tax=Pisolithus tinctorius Marx 270 TaxID=870435 RepID=A0A0C3N1L2_PISTI|nr:hypothetical protein BKA82DRAFT_167060 [Pisolithus tinctorius]KIN94964.1 hypothetical protein M404DRAFT_167060 [Pisolithus tinctorius Marx 270]
MSYILNEYDCFVIQGGGKTKSPGEDVAFSADGSRKSKGQKTKFSGTCFNCGWTGNRAENCWEEGGGKAGKAPKGWKPRGKKDMSGKDSRGGKANAAAEATSTEPDAVWLAEYSTGGVDEPETTSALPYATLALADSMLSTTMVELYDSGASQHLSPHRDHFINFETIPPKPITAADKCTFNAIR